MPTLTAEERATPALSPDQFQSLWAEIMADLTHTKDEIYAQIRAYPPPIPACDAQFNFLLEERAKIFQELGQAITLSKASLANPQPLALIEEFLQTSAYLHAEVKQKIHAALISTLVAVTKE